MAIASTLSHHGPLAENGGRLPAFPDGRRFAFTIIDDTDVATVENVRPMYELLHQLGMRTTKTVWPVGCPEGSRDFADSQTLEDDDYLAFVLDLRKRGFEITWHAATMESSLRERTIVGLERFRAIFGSYPRIHCSHGTNRENLYWGSSRFDSPILRAVFRRISEPSPDHYAGHIESSPFFWGDLCYERIEYVRNLAFQEINLARINPSMPYRDPRRPFGQWWFSASDADNVFEFEELLAEDAQERLVRERGFCIVATHLGKGFVQNGKVAPGIERQLRSLAKRDGWFPTAAELLDWLRTRRGDGSLPPGERRRMQWHWAYGRLRRLLRERRRRFGR